MRGTGCFCGDLGITHTSVQKRQRRMDQNKGWGRVRDGKKRGETESEVLTPKANMALGALFSSVSLHGQLCQMGQ